MRSNRTKAPKPRKVSDLKQIRALQSPVRLALIDLVEAHGPMSVAEMARLLDCAVDGLYYHLKIMTRSGWFVCSTALATNGRSMAVYDLAQPNYLIEYNPRDKRNRTAVTRMIAILLRASLKEFRRAYDGKPVVSGPRRNLWSGREISWMTADDLEDFNRLLHLLRFEIRKHRPPTKPWAKPISFTWMLSPYGGGRRSFKRGLRT